jgi:putative ABC transport system permease protein
MTLGEGLRLAAGLLVLAGLSTLIARRAAPALGWLPVWALLRAAVQLSAVAALLRGALTAPWLVVAFVVLMLSTATWTAGRRLRGLWRRWAGAVAGVLSGAGIALALVFLLHLVAFDARHVIATAGIVIGNAMSAATLAGRRFLIGARERRDEVEGWLALGAPPRAAHADIARSAVQEAVLPNLDQTKSTGLVTLPGAFVGALFGGASPADAARFQLVVLAALGLAMTTTAILVTRLAARTPYVVPEAVD